MVILRLARKIPPCLGGQEYHVRDLSIHQAKKGHTVQLSYGKGKNGSKMDNLFYKKISYPFWLNFLKSDLIDGFLFGLCALFSNLLQKKLKPELVHVHGDIFDILFGFFISKFHRAKLIVTVHAGLPNGVLYNFLAQFILKLPNAIICGSNDICRNITKISGRTNGLSYIHSGIYFEKFKRIKAYSISKPTKLVSVGRLHPMKGYKYLIEAVSSPEINKRVELTIIGEGELLHSLAKYADELKVKIIFRKRATKEEVANVLRSSDIFISSSVQLAKQTESTPTVILEAMASGLPIIATDTGGSLDIIKSDRFGKIVKHSCAKSLKDGLAALLDKPENLHTISKNNSQKAKDFDWSNIANLIEGVYNNTLTESLYDKK